MSDANVGLKCPRENSSRGRIDEFQTARGESHFDDLRSIQQPEGCCSLRNCAKRGSHADTEARTLHSDGRLDLLPLLWFIGDKSPDWGVLKEIPI
jgi:hypothetical protein